MRKRSSLEEKRKIIVDYIKENPNTTHRDIKDRTKLHVGRVFKSLEEAFKLARIKSPRTFKKKTKEEKRKIIINYLRKNPAVGGQTVKKDTKINLLSVFKNTEEAFKAAGLEYPRDHDSRDIKEKMGEILELIRKDSLVSISEITEAVKTQPYHLFKDMKEIYRKAGIPFISGRKKWKLKKRQRVINYIKTNPLSTQREINETCKTHVQLTFDGGIFEAYEKAGIKFPFERLKTYGIGVKRIREMAKKFEDEMAVKLSGYGKVNRLVKTKRGFADIILERKDKKIVIEIKDYQNKEISLPQVMQLNRYLEDVGCNLGILICHKKPKKDRYLIGKGNIFVLTKDEVGKIPKLIDGSVV